jgi:hypothetical protein
VPPSLKSWKAAAVVLWLVAAALVAMQTLLPGFIGMANNGDWGRVYGWLGLGRPGPETNFAYFQPDFVFSARNYWDSPYYSSEIPLAWLATRLAGATHEGAAFDIRWLGAIHIAICLAALALLLWTLRGRVALAILPVLMFTDVCYTAYFNSFYMDAVALCTLLLMVASGVALLIGEHRRLALAIFTFAALLFATSKTQHAIWAILPAALLLSRRGLAKLAAVPVLLAGFWMVATSDPAYRGQALFNVIFNRLGPAGADLSTLGVRPEEFRYSGMHAYMPASPAVDGEWAENFGKRTGFGRLLKWYVTHPSDTFHFMWQVLSKGAPDMRQSNLSNFPQSRGQPREARTNRFALWSNFRAELSRRWPWHLPLWYLIFTIACLRSRSRLKYLALGCALFGAGEFVAGALGDSLDPGRHHFLFQAATDLTLAIAVGGLTSWLAEAREA